MPWLRLWVDILDDPDLDALPEDACWAWAKLLAIAKRFDHGGQLPDRKRLYTWMRRPAAKVERWIADLIAAGLIEESDDGIRTMHGWARWQEPKDRTNAKRQADYRARHPKPPRNAVTPTDSETETDTDTDQTRGEQTLRNERNGVTPALRNGDGGGRAVTRAPDPETERVSRLAEELSGDVSWRIWAEQQYRLGHPARAVEESLRVCVDSGKWDRRFAGGVLKRLASEGYPANPTRAANGRHRPGEPQVNQPATAMNPPPGLEAFAAESAVLMAKYEEQQARRRKSS